MSTTVDGTRRPIRHRCVDCGALIGDRITARSDDCPICLGPIEPYIRSTER